MISSLVLLFWLLVAHAVCDYPLQGDFVAKAKNHRSPVPGIPFQWALFWHALMHGGGVALVTGSVAFGVTETVVHMLIDYCKCEGVTTFSEDQTMHVLSKVLIVFLLGLSSAS